MKHPILDYLEKVCKLALQGKYQPINGYTCMDHFVLKNGQEMPEIRPQDVWTGAYDFGAIGECFRNAALLAIGHKELTYCEGYGMGVFPVLHAWVIDEDGAVIDNTWGDMGTAYFGIAVNTTYLRQRLKAQKVYGLIDQPHFEWPMIRANPEEWKAEVR